ncbi:MAG: nucleotidyltransferase family protein [Spirulinaceae cyanobacterium]
MSADYPQDNLPTKEQQLLLQSSLEERKIALNAWQTWRGKVDIEDLNSESYHLLPLLYNNLSRYQVEDAEMVRLKGVYRRNWYNNQIFIKEITTILNSLAAAVNLETVLLKDGALVNYYQNIGLRPINHLDIFVAPQNAFAAIDVLKKLGWQAKADLTKEFIALYPKIGLWNQEGQLLHLNWQIWSNSLVENPSLPTVTININDLSTRILTPTQQLLYICQQIALAYPNLQPCWLADGKLIIEQHREAINWNLLLEDAQKYKLTIPLKNLLTFIETVFPKTIPPTQLKEIQSLPVSWFDSTEYRLVNSNPLPLIGSLTKRYLQYLRLAKRNQSESGILGFPKYLQRVWGLNSLWQLPYHTVVRGAKKIIS